jgi:SAM-dependent methyltransferase
MQSRRDNADDAAGRRRMNRDHRREYYRAWSLLTPPLRPHQQVVEAVRQQIGDQPGPTLLLGVTPELADISEDLVALDRNHSMVQHVWPGNTAARRAVVGDWRNQNFKPASFAVCVGDTSLGAMRFPDDVASVCREVVRLLRPGGKFVCRVYLSPDQRESVEQVRDAAWSGEIRNFHAFKFRLGMALIADRSEPRAPVDAILRTFNELFSDRDEISRRTGWSREQIDTIDFYRGSTVAFHFPTQDQLRAVVSRIFADVKFVAAGTYEFAERSPLLVARTG